jgi:hypothetical protein
LREFIKRHPWQLEIVPFVVLILAFVVPAIYWHEIRAQVRPWNGYSADQTWMLRYVLRGITAVGWLIIASVDSNDIWVRFEHTKRFNWWALWSSPTLALMGWYMSDQSFGALWLALALLSFLPQILIEKSRRFIPQETVEESKPVPLIQPGEPFYYKEEKCRRPFLLRSVLGMLVIAPALWTVVEDGSGVVWMLGVSSLVTILTMRIFVSVSRERVTARAGWRRVSIPISHIRDVAIYDYDPLSGKRKGWVTTYDRMSIYAPGPGPCLRIETTDGKAYLLGVKDPEAFGNLIRAAMEGVRPSQS